MVPRRLELFGRKRILLAESDDKSSEFGFNIGAGLGFPVGTNTQFSIVGTYHVVPGNNLENMENTNNAQIRVGLGVEL